MTFRPNGNLVDQITDYISEKIVCNELKPGMRLYDTKLAEEMGVSRTPIREALRILERNRLVQLIPRRGVVVTEISTEQIEWFYDIFEQLYALVARKAAENRSEEDIEAIEEALGRIEACAAKGEVVGYYNRIFEFAQAGMKAAKNPLLESMIRDMWPVNRRIQYASLLHRKDNLKENVKLFQKAVRHMKTSSGRQAESVIREYARTEKKFALELIQCEENS